VGGDHPRNAIRQILHLIFAFDSATSTESSLVLLALTRYTRNGSGPASHYRFVFKRRSALFLRPTLGRGRWSPPEQRNSTERTQEVLGFQSRHRRRNQGDANFRERQTSNGGAASAREEFLCSQSSRRRVTRIFGRTRPLRQFRESEPPDRRKEPEPSRHVIVAMVTADDQRDCSSADAKMPLRTPCEMSPTTASSTGAPAVLLPVLIKAFTVSPPA